MTASTSTRRRWMAFSLRTFFIIGVMGLYAWTAYQQRREVHQGKEEQQRAQAQYAKELAIRSKRLELGSDARDWSLVSWSDGKDRNLQDYRGKIVLLDFWGTGCGPCVMAIPAMQALAEKYEKQGVVFLGIHLAEGNMDEINKLKKLWGWTTPTAIDVGTSNPESETASRYGVRGIPTVILIAPDGTIAFNSSIEPEDKEAHMNAMKKLAESLDLPWPLKDDADQEEAAKQWNKLLFAIYSAEIDKALSASSD